MDLTVFQPETHDPRDKSLPLRVISTGATVKDDG